MSKQADHQDNEIFRGRVFAITNNRLEPRSVKGASHEGGKLKNMVASMMAKGESGTGELTLYVFRGGPVKSATVLPKLLRGTWTGHKSVKVESSAQFFIQATDTQETSFILDGEIKKTRYPLDVGIIPKDLRIFKPE